MCDDDEVRAWAEAQGAEAIWTPGLGLNGAVEAGVAHLARRGVDRVVVAHADLPLATDLTWLADTDGVTLVPDRHRDGTNVACVPADGRVLVRVRRRQLRRPPGRGRRASGSTVRLVPDPRLGWDVDVAGRPRACPPSSTRPPTSRWPVPCP